MSAATVDTSLGSLRTRLDGPRRAMLRTISAVEGHDETETEAIHRIVEDRYMALPSADSVDAGKPCSVAPERPEGGPGQGTTRPPAPTIYPTLTEMVDVLGRIANYVEDEWSGTVAAEPLGLVGQARAIAAAVAYAPKTDGGGAGSGNAPGPDADDVPPSAAACNAPTVATTLPPACDTCGERSEHEVCS